MLAIGTNHPSGFLRSAYAFARGAQGEWSFEHRFLPDLAAAEISFARFLALDGGRLLISSSEAAYLYRRDPPWILEIKFVAANGELGADFVALHDTLAIVDGKDECQLYSYEFDGQSWLEECRDVPSSMFSGAVHNQRVVVGNPFDTLSQSSIIEIGSAYLLDRVNNVWRQPLKFTATEPPFTDKSSHQFGRAVAVYEDRILIGAWNYNWSPGGAQGAAFIYEPYTSPDCNANGLNDACDIDFAPSEDCNTNEIPDECDIADLTSEDCTLNGIPDECEPDCNGNGAADSCDIADGISFDCNGNGLSDTCDLASGASDDCNDNDIPDECEVAGGADCNGNLEPDDCDIAFGLSEDCTANGVPDECELDCNANFLADTCDIAAGTSSDCDADGVPDECGPDCNVNDLPDVCDVVVGGYDDCNENLTPDECELAPFEIRSFEFSPLVYPTVFNVQILPAPPAIVDVTLSFEASANLFQPTEFLSVSLNGTLLGTVFEEGASNCANPANTDVVVVAPEVFNGLLRDGPDFLTVAPSPDVGDQPCGQSSYANLIVEYRSIGEPDCNVNNVLDACEIFEGTTPDCNGNGIPDVCEADCNGNAIADDCDLASGTSFDCSGDGVLDECEPDCDGNGVPNACDIAAGASEDLNGDGVPDECQCPPGPPQLEPIPTAKNRFLTLTETNAGQQIGRRVTFVDLPPPFDLWNGAELWVGPVATVSESAAAVAPAGGNANFTAATLQCTPHYADWAGLGMVHVFHEGIVPGGAYLVDAIDVTCDAGDPASYSAPIVHATAFFGDTVRDLSTVPPPPPEGEVNVVDAIAILGRFASAPGAIVKARADLEPACLDMVINVSDVLMSLRGFAGLGYPFAPTAADPCGSTCVSPLP